MLRMRKQLISVMALAVTFSVGAQGFAASPSASVPLQAPTNVGGYFKVENGWMISWSNPSNLSSITGYTVTASNGAKCVAAGSSTNQCIYSSSTVPNPFKPFVPYTFTVVSNSAGGSSAPSVPSNVMTQTSAPGYPAPLLTKATSDTQMTAEWVPSPSTGGISIYGYRLTYWEVSLNSMGDPKNETRVDLMTPQTSAVVNGLKPSPWY